MRSAGVYVHFPYCLAKCPYCDFVSYAIERSQIDHRAYADAVIAELEARIPELPEGWKGHSVGSVFFGGGTPSLWEPEELGRVLASIRTHLPLTPDCEITVECNPTSLDETRARALGAVGVNRLSVGTQSLRADQLKFLGRLHDPAGATAAVKGALASGVERVSTDLIFGLPEQPPEDARDQALALADLGLRHLSAYQLTIEPGTRFGELARRGRLPLADDGFVADAFLAVDEALTGRGFRHYEVSNFAHPGHESRHNLGYWQGQEYLGLGCGAYGFVRDGSRATAKGVRYRNEIDPEGYKAKASTLRELTISEEPLDGEAMLRERIMLGLRLEEGFDLEAAAADLGVDPLPASREKALHSLIARGRIEAKGSSLRIPRRGWLWADDTAASLF